MFVVAGSGRCNGFGCGSLCLSGKRRWAAEADSGSPEEQQSASVSRRREANRADPDLLKMMFDHSMVTPLGLHRKPSKVETAKRFWRVSLIVFKRLEGVG